MTANDCERKLYVANPSCSSGPAYANALQHSRLLQIRQQREAVDLALVHQEPLCRPPRPESAAC